MSAATQGRLTSLTIFFPCYNEEANVRPMTEAALHVGRRVTDDLEVIIVNDGSRDGTAEIADALAAEHPGVVHAVHNNPNRGYGGALQAGFRAATREWIFYTDGDGQFDLEEIDRVIKLLEDYDIASAYRIKRQDSWVRKLNAACWGTLIRALFRMRIRDIDCAFKIYPKRFIDAIELVSEGALIDTEMLARATIAGYCIGQVGVSHHPRTAGSQTGANITVILRAFGELWRLRKQILATTHRKDSA